MQAIITNNIRIKDIPAPIRATITKALTYDNPAVAERLKRRQPIWGMERKLRLYIEDRGDLIVPRGYLNDLIAVIMLAGYDPVTVILDDTVTLPPVDFGEWNSKYTLQPDQAPAVAALTMNGVLVAPAGSGKTVMGLRRVWELKQPALWLTHTKDLLIQTTKKAKELMGNVGDIGHVTEGHFFIGNGRLVIATVQTLNAHPDYVDYLNPIIGTIVVDECHHFPAPAFVDVVGQFKARHVLGLTATPDRKDKLELYMYRGIGPELYKIDRSGLYEAGRLIKPEVKFIYTNFSFEPASMRDDEINNVDAGGEDLNYHEVIDALIKDEERAKQIAENIIENAANNYQIVISESIRYCYILHDLVEKIAKARWGVVPRMAVVHGSISRYAWRVVKSEWAGLEMMQQGKAAQVRYNAKTKRWEVQVSQYTEEEYRNWQVSDAERKDIMERAGAKEIDILFASTVAREGLDIPHLNRGHMVTPKKGDSSQRKDGAALEQELGRIMRFCPDNPGKQAIWYDYVDYNVGIFRAQYSSRRKVYERLGLKLPKKPRTKMQEIEDFLGQIDWEG